MADPTRGKTETQDEFSLDDIGETAVEACRTVQDLARIIRADYREQEVRVRRVLRRARKKREAFWVGGSGVRCWAKRLSCRCRYCQLGNNAGGSVQEEVSRPSPPPVVSEDGPSVAPKLILRIPKHLWLQAKWEMERARAAGGTLRNEGEVNVHENKPWWAVIV